MTTTVKVDFRSLPLEERVRKFANGPVALHCAQSFKQMCQDELKAGLINTTCPGCGAGMQFAVGRSHSKCPACGETWDQYMKRLELIA